VDYWVQNTLEGYIIKFSMENHQSFSKAKVVFHEGTRGRFSWEIYLWIKVLLVEEGMFHVPFTNMAV